MATAMQPGGNDISSLVRNVLRANSDGPPRSFTAQRVAVRRMSRRSAAEKTQAQELTAYGRMVSSALGQAAFSRIRNETETMRALSILSVEVLYEYLRRRDHRILAGSRCLTVPGELSESPVLLILDPRVALDRGAELITDVAEVDANALQQFSQAQSLDLLRNIDSRLNDIEEAPLDDPLELLWITRPEIIRARLPRMVPICSPIPHVRVECNGQFSSAGVFCRDPSGTLGVSACYHGTGDVGTAVLVDGVASTVALADRVQDIVFVPLHHSSRIPPLHGVKGPRSNRAPSQAEPVRFDGAGSGTLIQTNVQSHDSGILRRRATVQLKVQTPASTNAGDSGCALIDSDDYVLGFGFEQSAFGESPQLTDWIWADNALASLGLTPV